MSDLLRQMALIYTQPDSKPYQYVVGQRVRLRTRRSADGQTPAFWDGAVVVVEGRYTTGLHKEHWYHLAHQNGRVGTFCEDEIDARFARRTIK